MKTGGLSTLVVTLLIAGMLTCAQAQEQDASPIKFYAAYGMQTDSNLFRRPSSSTSDTAETINTSTLGFSLDTTQSLQRFELDISLVDYRYQNFSYLNFTARNYEAAWRWAITPRFTGSLTSSRKETLNSFTDTVNQNIRNQRTDTQDRFDADWALVGPWHLVAGVSHLRQSNQQALVAGGDYATRSGEVGIRYAFKSGSAIVFATRLNNGTYLNRVVPNTALLDDSFKQLDNEARLRWDLGGGSVVDANLTHINRTHPLYAQRDFSGFNTGAYLSLRLTGKSAFTAGYSHELAEYGASNSNYTQTDRISLGPVWQVSPKVTLRLNQKWSQIAYLGSPTEGLSNNRSDFTRDTAITLSWQPLKQLGLSTSFQNIARSTNVANLDYDSNQLNFSAQLNY